MRAKAIAFAFVFAAIITGVVPHVPRARAVSLTFGPGGAAVAMEHVSVLYAGRPGGAVVPIVRVGDRAPGGTISELGVPYQLSGGRVLFGATIIDSGQHESWDILIANPAAHGDTQITRALEHAAVAPGCAPHFVEDPSPVANKQGTIAFAAPAKSGGDAIFLYREGELRCSAHTGDTTDRGHQIAKFSFGSMALAPAGTTIIASAYLRGGPSRAARSALWWHDDPLAIVEIAPGRPIAEIAVEGEIAPGGKRYGVLGLPALAGARGAGAVVFADDGPGENAVYIFDHARARRALERGAATSAGAITFIGTGRPGLAPDGTIALRGASGPREIIMRLDRRGQVRIVATAIDSDPAPSGALASFGDPIAAVGPATIFPAMDSTGQQGIFLADPRGSVHQVDSAPLHDAAFEVDAPARHYVASSTLSTAADGGFCYLGGR